MCAVLLRSLSSSLSSAFLREKSELWKSRYKNEHDQERLGLGFQDALKKYGFVWLPLDLFDWTELQIRSDLIDKVTFTHNRLRGVFKDWRGQRVLDQKLECEKQLTKDYQNAIDQNDQRKYRHCISIFEQKIYAAFVRYLFNLRKRCYPGLEELSREERGGYHGLSADIARRLLDCEPNIILPRGSSLPKGIARATFHYENEWIPKINGLFQWNDGLERTWENAPYRRQAKVFYDIILKHEGIKAADLFKGNLGKHASKYLWIIPAWDQSTFAKYTKRSEYQGNCHRTRQRFQRMSEAERQRWIVARHLDADNGEVDADSVDLDDCSRWRLISKEEELDEVPHGIPPLMTEAMKWDANET